MCGGDFPHLPALLLKEIPSTTFHNLCSTAVWLRSANFVPVRKVWVGHSRSAAWFAGIAVWSKAVSDLGRTRCGGGSALLEFTACASQAQIQSPPGVIGDNCDGPAMKDTLGSVCSECCGNCWTFR